MWNPRKIEPIRERGVALLIAIFALVLIAGVSVAMLSMSASETSVAESYRSSAQAFYAALAGLEEGRGRIWMNHPANANDANRIVPQTGILLADEVVYILNPSAGEAVNPANLSDSNRYRDVQYETEFGVPVTSRVIRTVNSTSTSAGLAGPMFKWVRVNPKTEASTGIDVNGDGVLDPLNTIFYDGKNQFVFTPGTTKPGRQVYSVTALAVLPNRARRMLQYEIGATTFNLNFPAALTMDGEGVAYWPAHSSVFWMDGNDSGACGVAEPPKPAIGTITQQDADEVRDSIPPNRRNRYIGSGSPPSVEDISGGLDPRYLDPASLEELTQQIRENADQVLERKPDGSPNTNDDMLFGSPDEPLITYVDGDLTLDGNVTGYGILVVTGKFTMAGTVGWRGIVLVVGEGEMEVNGGGNNSIDGAVLLANIYNDDGTLRDDMGPTVLDWSGGGGSGVYYNSCWVNNAQNGAAYRVLSFREIPED
jgi:hypothetical protein